MQSDQAYALRRGYESLSAGTVVYILDPEANLVVLRSDLTKVYTVPIELLEARRPRTKIVTLGERAAKKKARQIFKRMKGAHAREESESNQEAS